MAASSGDGTRTSFQAAFINCRGLENKLKRKSDGISMEQFIQRYDFVGLNEVQMDISKLGEDPMTNPLPDVPVQGYTLFCEPEKAEATPKLKLSGGVGLLVRNHLRNYCARLENYGNPSVALKVAENVYGFEWVLGVHYFHINSWRNCTARGKGARQRTPRNRQNELKEQIYNAYHPPPDQSLKLLVMGDFNAFLYNSRDDQLTGNDHQNMKVKNITPLHILNLHTKFGEKARRGTCHQTADADRPRVIDFALASDKLLEFIQDFEVLPFISSISDCHSALEIKFEINGLLEDSI